jgi:hypothetical protein
LQVVKAVAGAVPVLVDGGIRRGTDVFKAVMVRTPLLSLSPSKDLVGLHGQFGKGTQPWTVGWLVRSDED